MEQPRVDNPSVPPRPVLGYGFVLPRFGWVDGLDGSATLALPPPPNWPWLVRQGAALAVELAIFVGVAAAWLTTAFRGGPGRSAWEPLQSPLLAIVLIVGFWCTLHAIDVFRTARRGGLQAVVAVSAERLAATGGLPPGRPSCDVPRAEITDVRLDPVPSRFWRRPRRVVLHLSRPDDTWQAMVLPWPPGEPTEPHEARLRFHLALRPEDVAAAGAATAADSTDARQTPAPTAYVDDS